MNGQIRLGVPNQAAGGYRMGEGESFISFNLQRKPHWLHRLGVRLVLGWKLVDA